jgi:hypothetical protein
MATVDSHLIFLNINKINTCLHSVLFSNVSALPTFPHYALSYTIFIKISYCCYHEIWPMLYSQIELRSYNFHPGRLHFLGSLFTYLCHTVMPINRINSRGIFTKISQLTPNILLKRTDMFLFTPSATTDKLASLHETVQLLLSYIPSRHLRLTQIRSLLTVMHTNNSWTSFISYLPGPLN